MPQLSRQTGSSLLEINIVPFVDVVLVILVIFMITAPILQSGIEVDVPKTKTVKEISESRVVVSIDRAQRIYIGDDPVNIHELGDKVHSQMRNPQADPIYLRCDKTVPFGSFARRDIDPTANPAVHDHASNSRMWHRSSETPSCPVGQYQCPTAGSINRKNVHVTDAETPISK